jgi:hypothetical protein
MKRSEAEALARDIATDLAARTTDARKADAERVRKATTGGLAESLVAARPDLESAPDEVKAAANALYAYLMESGAKDNLGVRKAIANARIEDVHNENIALAASATVLLKNLDALEARFDRAFVKSQQPDGQEDRNEPTTASVFGDLFSGRGNGNARRG